MITKFKTIKNLAVFQDFDWDSNLRDNGNNVVLFKPINIFYGRNYSGKTTLSRIVRALETSHISDKYNNPEFEICIKDTQNATQLKLSEHGKKIRVFNEDFVKENLKFISNPDDSIIPFAILGGNASIESQIQLLKDELGKDEEDNESGFYLELKNAKAIAKSAYQNYDSEKRNLENQLSNKATNNPNGIKYKSEKYGDQNYTKPKLINDLTAVLKTTFIPLTDEEITQKTEILKETVNRDIPASSQPIIDLDAINQKAKELITKPISSSNKIEELVKEAVLNRWVKEGRNLHKGKLKICTFCGNEITEKRWAELDSHFDEESEKLEKEIEELIRTISSTIEYVKNQIPINKQIFYSKFHINLDRLTIYRDAIINSITSELENLKTVLNYRKENLLNPQNYTNIIDKTKRLEWCWKIYENIRLESNEFSNSLGDEKRKAQKLLRLREVFDFANDIQYNTKLISIQELKANAETKKQKQDIIAQKIKEQIEKIEDNERLMNDEEKGAIKVNEYLNNFFGHDFLSLQALEKEDQNEGKKIRFEIIRNGNKAYHLSEGECSLIAFCYFMAKLEDIDTKGSKPIIWIDDPISSLDSNHIFFVYSLINSEIFSTQEYEQIFISTHNLDFLKYLKRLPDAGNKNKCCYFIINRENETSKIKLMPRYLKDYVTEFNYLFHQIYICSIADEEDEEQHQNFYNFGNNTRKFLEAFLYYKFPNAINDKEKLSRFFGDNRQASTMINRINNEFSHLEGLFERSMTPIDIPEMKKTAKFILDKIKEKDNEQFEALLLSIGIEINEDN